MSTRSALPVVAAGTLAVSLLHCGGGDLQTTTTGSGGGTTAQSATGASGMESSTAVGTGSSSVVGSAASTGVGGGSGLVPGPVDAVIAQMPPDSWKELPATPMADVCPTPTDHYACGAVMTAWSGGAYDSSRDRLVVFGGGHNDSWSTTCSRSISPAWPGSAGPTSTTGSPATPCLTSFATSGSRRAGFIRAGRRSRSRTRGSRRQAI